MSRLSKWHRSRPELCERFEGFMGRKELCYCVYGVEWSVWAAVGFRGAGELHWFFLQTILLFPLMIMTLLASSPALVNFVNPQFFIWIYPNLPIRVRNYQGFGFQCFTVLTEFWFKFALVPCAFITPSSSLYPSWFRKGRKTIVNLPLGGACSVSPSSYSIWRPNAIMFQ